MTDFPKNTTEYPEVNSIPGSYLKGKTVMLIKVGPQGRSDIGKAHTGTPVVYGDIEAGNDFLLFTGPDKQLRVPIAKILKTPQGTYRIVKEGSGSEYEIVVQPETDTGDSVPEIQAGYRQMLQNLLGKLDPRIWLKK